MESTQEETRKKKQWRPRVIDMGRCESQIGPQIRTGEGVGGAFGEQRDILKRGRCIEKPQSRAIEISRAPGTIENVQRATGRHSVSSSGGFTYMGVNILRSRCDVHWPMHLQRIGGESQQKAKAYAKFSETPAEILRTKKIRRAARRRRLRETSPLERRAETPQKQTPRDGKYL